MLAHTRGLVAVAPGPNHASRWNKKWSWWYWIFDAVVLRLWAICAVAAVGTRCAFLTVVSCLHTSARAARQTTTITWQRALSWTIQIRTHWLESTLLVRYVLAVRRGIRHRTRSTTPVRPSPWAAAASSSNRHSYLPCWRKVRRGGSAWGQWQLRLRHILRLRLGRRCEGSSA